MNMKFNRKMSEISLRYSSGMTLLDVLLGIVIFVVGMLALASLQGNLTRSTAEGNARTVGTNFAEEIIERMRVFSSLRSTDCPTGDDPDLITEVLARDAYQCIVDSSTQVTRNGLVYTVNAVVSDWYFDDDGVTVTDDVTDLDNWEDLDLTISAFKRLDLTISWNANDFLDNEGNVIDAGTLGAGSFTISGIVPSIPQLGSAEIAAEDDGELGGPPILYTPGSRPDIIAINVQGSKFKESSTPAPELVKGNDLVENWFDVVTYNNLTNSTYLRREEFLVVTCECTLKSKGSDETGLLPTVWNGEEYVTGNDGEMVAKAYGVSANNQQSQYCDTCCRDHHDADDDYSGDRYFYDPSREWTVDSATTDNHEHYTRSNQGVLSVAGTNDNYVEACRMVRKDGFMRVAQDFRQESLLAFPSGYLDTLAGANEYSEYVTNAVLDFYAEDRDTLTPPSGVAEGSPQPAWGYDFPADKTPIKGDYAEDSTDTTSLPLLGLDSQQMRSRAVYIDRLTPEVEALLTTCGTTTDLDSTCLPEGITNILQILPFYEVQTTWLTSWLSDPAGDPVSVTSETVNNTTYSRGLAVLEDSAANDQVKVMTDMYRSNIGLTVTDPITEKEKTVGTVEAVHDLYMDVGLGDDGSEDDTKYLWSGTLESSVNQIDAANAVVTPGGNAFCSRSGIDILCSTPVSEGGSITITGYTRQQGQTWVPYWICLSRPGGLSITAQVDDGANNSTTISWPPGTTPDDVIISIESEECSTIGLVGM
jgi:Tfp pilus assembly protein PilV